MSQYIYGGPSYQLGADGDAPVIESVDVKLDRILRWQGEEDTRRHWTLAFTIAGAFLAAVKLGIVVIPKFRKKQAHSLGQLTSLVSNPRRRRRR